MALGILDGPCNFVGHGMFYFFCIIACGYLWSPLLLQGGSWAFPHESHLFVGLVRSLVLKCVLFEVPYCCGASWLKETFLVVPRLL